MKKITAPLVLLFLYISFIFELEKIPLSPFSEILLHNYLDILVLVMVIFTISFRFFEKLPSYACIAFWLIVYFLLWFIEPKSPSFQSEIQILVLEVVIVATGAFLVRKLIKKVVELDTTMNDLIMSAFKGRTLKMAEGEKELRTELLRSRRYQHPLTVLFIKPDPKSVDKRIISNEKEIQYGIARRYTLGKISESLNITARRPDVVIKQEDSDNFIIICPETAASNSKILIQRIKETLAASMEIEVEIGTATFPDEALTYEDLIRKAFEKTNAIAIDLLPKSAENKQSRVH